MIRRSLGIFLYFDGRRNNELTETAIVSHGLLHPPRRLGPKVQELVAACHKYLTGHTGTVYFSVGTLNRTLTRPVNDLGYDVTINVVFESREAHDIYQTEPRHLKFIEEQKPNWKQVRVFDSDLVSA